MALLAMGSSIARAQDNIAQRHAQDSIGHVQDSITQLHARDSTDPVRKKIRHSHLEVGMSYQSNNVYLGRKDSPALHYYIPAVSYYHKSGLFFTTSLNYLKNSTVSRIDLFTLEAGYMFKAHKYDGIFSVSRYYYNDQSTNLAAAINEAIAYSNGYDLGFVKPRLTATMNIGSKVDIEGRLDLEHSFTFLKDNLDITPTFSVAGSTLNYYDYYRRRKYKIQKKNSPTQTGIADVTGSVINASAFRLMDYEPSLPIEYSIGKCTLSFTPTYAIPVNAATIGITTVRQNGASTTRTQQEQIGNTFYFTGEFSIMF